MTSAIVQVMNNQKKWIRCRILLDSCATANFVTEAFARRLLLPLEKCALSVGTMSTSSLATRYSVTIKLKSIHNEFEKTLPFLTVPKIVDRIPNETIPRETLSIPGNICLADPEFHKPAEVQMLLGSGPTLSLFSIGQINLSSNGADLFLQKTRLGWVIGGSLGPVTLPSRTSCNISNLENLLTKFWEVEEIGTSQDLEEIAQCPIEAHFQKHMKRDHDGRFVVALPFKRDPNTLGESRSQAIARLQALQRRFERNSNLKEQYSAAMQDYLNKGYMSIVKDGDLEDGYYTPHHAVIKNSSMTTKWRIVFNFSAPSSTGVSLNAILHNGPTIQNSTFVIHLRFRIHKVVIMGDIEKMYLQVKVRAEDRKFQRAVWFDKDKLITIESNTLTFGETSAPYLAIRCLHQLACDHEITHPAGANAIKYDTYVDNLASGAKTVAQAIEIKRKKY